MVPRALVLLAALVVSTGSAPGAPQCPTQVEESVERAGSSLQAGLTFMWTTPVLRLSMLDANAAQLQELAENVELAFREFERDCVTRSGETANDAFFARQLQAWERDDESFLVKFDGGSGFLLEQLRNGWMSNLEAYVSGAVGEEMAATFFDDELMLFIWASVHEGCSAHTPHIHENSAVSGVFYVSVPAAAGDITFDDPRGMRPPFARNRLSHTPVVGELLLFPPWLVHGVSPSCGMDDGKPRIALSFNLLSGRDPKVQHAPSSSRAGERPPDWELLSDSSFLMDGGGE
mmetsp:Transcript_77/g.248  ORF Transcript_77/g.248 Transcript_77/m.248 type:complete len:290 (+) Transcript_77:32-901(+)